MFRITNFNIFLISNLGITSIKLIKFTVTIPQPKNAYIDLPTESLDKTIGPNS